MPILLLGLDHHAPVEVRERAAFLAAEREADLLALLERPGVVEAVILSTCNRTELYAVCSDPGAHATLQGFLMERKGLTEREVEHHVTPMFQEEAAAHLFRVAAGLESQILGEGQILAQVKEALASAQACHASGAILDALFRRALTAGKRARTETDIARGAVSVAGAAVELARSLLGSLQGRAILLLGTGKIGEVAARQLASSGLSAIYLANRSLESASRLAELVKGEAVAYHDLGAVLGRVDVLLCCTGAPHHVLSAADLAPVVARRAGRPLLLIDLSVPRNLDPAIARLEGCRLCDLDDLRGLAERHRSERSLFVPMVEGILAQELAAFFTWQQGHQVAPTIAAWRSKLAMLQEQELDRFWLRHGGRFTAEQRRLVDEAIQALFDKLAHGPLSRLKELDGTRQQQLAEALVTLFDLNVEDVEPHQRRRLAKRRGASDWA
ncbi:MAG TPA: glutamyl-tRNA reductase [Stenomitos sp.]